MMSEKKLIQIEVNAAEEKILEMIREIEFGQILITIKHGTPIRVEEIRKSIDLK